MTQCCLYRLAGAFLLLLLATDAFAPPQQHHPILRVTAPAPALSMAGFGGGASSKKKKSSKNKKTKNDDTQQQKLKPRKQWDRYLGDELKDADSVRVAVRVLGKDKPKWFEVGAVKSKDNAHTEAAVIRHRMLVADHARRMFPLQILAKDKLEWGFSTTAADNKQDGTVAEDDTTEWTIAGKVEQMPEDIDKMIGFKGLPDPTGFYGYSKGAGLKAGDSMDQAGYLNMKSKGITGHTGHEIHD